MKGFPTITHSYRLWRVWQAEKYEAKKNIYLEQRKYEPRAHLLGETLPQFFFFTSLPEENPPMGFIIAIIKCENRPAVLL